jgi:GT2 family glycosyltransferase
MKKITVVIVAYKSEVVIFDCLDSLEIYNDIGNNLEVIIVDNSPKNLLEEKVVSYGMMSYRFQYIHNPKNGGFGQGNNIGALASDGDVLLFLNPDTILVESIFLSLVTAVYNGFNVGGYSLVGPDKVPNATVGLLPELSYLSIPLRVLRYFAINTSFISTFIYPWGASMFITREVFFKAGSFDESIFLCNEEPDLMKRIKNPKLTILKNIIIHLDGHTTDVKSDRYDAFLDSTSLYFKKHGFKFTSFLCQSKIKANIKLCYKKLLARNCHNEIMILKRIKQYHEKNHTS